ncbi:MAG: hypothetical protein IT428_02525 [Planctomycetaceae bacterium]|nr:hypothetical protein [Planctomycetaceae bacterium]
MRPYRPDDDMEVLDAAEIDAALEAALSTPLDALLTNEEFTEKLETSDTNDLTAEELDHIRIVAEKDQASLDNADADDLEALILEFERRKYPKAA